MKIYLDNAATTKPFLEVIKELNRVELEFFGNASSMHSFGRKSQHLVDISRENIANAFNAKSEEIYFTSGGSESNNWVLYGVVESNTSSNKHIITSKIEHPAVLETVRKLEKKGVSVTYVGVDSKGLINPAEIEKAITDDTILVSIMYANNEVGTIQPIKSIGEICRREGVLFHTDAVQAVGHLDIDVKDLNIDMMSFSAHKFNGPKGIGGLYKSNGVKITSLITGGSQERNERAGTTVVPLIAGMAMALDLTVKNRDATNKKITEKRNYFIEKVLTSIPYSYLNGDLLKRLPNNINISFEFIEGESLLMLLDLAGIAVSSGSACASGALEASHVIEALGVKEELSHSSVRFSLGHDTTYDELDFTLKTLADAVAKLRAMSPLFDTRTGEGKYV